jgi:integration host factor subunit beta
MLKSELVKRIRAQSADLSQRQAQKIVDAIFEEISSAIARGDRVELRRFGAFTPKVRASRVGRNPKTRTDVPVPKKVVPRFKPAREMHERLNATPAGGAIDLPGRTEAE